MPPKVYVIIVTYNAMKWVDKCFTSLRNSSVKVFPVVVDNLSKDETVMYIKENYPEVYVIENKDNRGFGQANNQGIEYAYKQGATHFFLLNQDAWIETNAIANTIAVQDKYQIGIASPVHLNGDGNLLDYNFYRTLIINEDNRPLVSDLLLNQLKPYYPIFKINAAAWIISREVIDLIGGFDPVFFHYGEDGNYCQRLHYHGKSMAIIPTAFVCHDRERQGNQKVYNARFTLMNLLYSYGDVSMKHFKHASPRIKMHLFHLKGALNGLIKLDFKKFGQTINGYWQFVKLSKKLRNNKKMNREVGSHWLSL